MEALIHSNERLDDLCRKGYRLIQDPKLFCFGIDAVLLSDYAKVKRGERAVDLCTGNGVIPILLEAKNNGEHYSGLELQPQCADLARRSVKYNHLEDKVTIEEGDVCNASEIFGRESVEVVTVNPPYMIGQHGIKNADDAMTIARHEVRCTLDDIVRESAKMLNQVRSANIIMMNLTVFPDTELEKWCKDGSFVQASGRERIEELAYLLEALELTTPTGFSTSHVTNPVMITGTLPYDKEKMLEGVYKMLGSGKESDLHGIVSISDAAIER